VAACGAVFQINVSRGSVPKRAIASATVDARGVLGDAQTDLRHHGGPERALCLFPLELIRSLQAEGHDIEPGHLGENVTTVDLDWQRVVPGARLRLGDRLVIVITGYAAPCWKNARWFTDGDFNRLNQQSQPGRSRVYARVLVPGDLRTGDPIALDKESAAVRVARTQPPTLRWRPPAG